MSTESIKEALLASLPSGAYDPNGEIVVREATATAETLHSAELLIDTILLEQNPANANFSLEDWERMLGLPDGCTTTAQTPQQRVAAVVDKWTARGGISKAYFIAMAARRGVTVTIDELGLYSWRLNAPMVNLQPFRVGQNRMGDRLRIWGDAEMECRVKRLKPAHTRVVFGYV